MNNLARRDITINAIAKDVLTNKIIDPFNGQKDLKQKIIEYFNLEKIEVKDATYLTNARQNALIKNTISYIDQALEDIETEVPVDMIEINIRAAWDTLGEIIGATYKDELLDELFSNFCLGK